MSRPRVHLKAAALHHPWQHFPAAAGTAPGPRELPAARRARRDAIGDRVCAILIMGLVVVMLAGWLGLGAAYAREIQRDGPAAAARIGQITMQPPQIAEEQAVGETGGIDIAAWTPVWIGVDLIVFVALGLFLRSDQGRKP